MSLFGKVTIREGHDNFFTPMRLFFALMVMVGHAFVVTAGYSEDEPRIFFEYTMSYSAVNLFFIVSGFLVTKSMLYREDMVDYAAARILRIMPALAVHVLFVMLIIGPIVTTRPLWEFLTHPDLLLQPFKVLTFFKTQMVMPGVFENNHEQLASATLWTLRYEVLAYIGTAIAFGFGLLGRRWMIGMQFVVFAVAWPVFQITGLFEQVPGTVQNILRFGLCYGLGALIYAYRERFSFYLLAIPLLGGFTALFHATPLFEVMFAVWLGYITFWMAYVVIPKLDILKDFEDVSYGIYIYHWVVLQSIFHFIPGIGIFEMIVFTLPTTLILSHLSWRWVEKPALRSKKRFANWMNTRLGKEQERPVPALAE